MAMTYDTSDAFGWSDLRTATRALDDTNVPRFEVERAATPPTTLGGIIAAGHHAVILAIVRDANRERLLAEHLRRYHGLMVRQGEACSPGSIVRVHFIHSDHMERVRGLRGDVVVGGIQPSWEGARLLDPRGMNIRVEGKQAERAFWGMVDQVAPPAPTLMVNGHRCPASLRVDVTAFAAPAHGPTQTMIDVSGEVADGEMFVACVERASLDGCVVAVGAALGDGKSTTLQGFVCSFGMAGHRLTAKLVCAPVRTKSAATLPDAFFDASCAGMTQEAKRRAAEAPLVALVNAVPKGLDPNGWRAAVLAVAEAYKTNGAAGTLGEKFAPILEVAIRDGLDERDANAPHAAGVTAYVRAITPQGKRPQPERRRTPGLPLDVDAELAGLDAMRGR